MNGFACFVWLIPYKPIKDSNKAQQNSSSDFGRIGWSSD